MKTATYTKIKNSETYNDNELSIGFRRLTCLPKRLRKAINVRCIIDGMEVSEAYTFLVDFFENMTELEYKQYITTH